MLQLRDLAKHFGGLRAVDDVSLEVRAGETYGLLGRTAPAKPPPSR